MLMKTSNSAALIPNLEALLGAKTKSDDSVLPQMVRENIVRLLQDEMLVPEYFAILQRNPAIIAEFANGRVPPNLNIGFQTLLHELMSNPDMRIACEAEPAFISGAVRYLTSVPVEQMPDPASATTIDSHRLPTIDDAWKLAASKDGIDSAHKIAFVKEGIVTSLASARLSDKDFCATLDRILHFVHQAEPEILLPFIASNDILPPLAEGFGSQHPQLVKSITAIYKKALKASTDEALTRQIESKLGQLPQALKPEPAPDALSLTEDMQLVDLKQMPWRLPFACAEQLAHLIDQLPAGAAEQVLTPQLLHYATPASLIALAVHIKKTRPDALQLIEDAYKAKPRLCQYQGLATIAADPLERWADDKGAIYHRFLAHTATSRDQGLNEGLNARQARSCIAAIARSIADATHPRKPADSRALNAVQRLLKQELPAGTLQKQLRHLAGQRRPRFRVHLARLLGCLRRKPQRPASLRPQPTAQPA